MSEQEKLELQNKILELESFVEKAKQNIAKAKEGVKQAEENLKQSEKVIQYLKDIAWDKQSIEERFRCYQMGGSPENATIPI
ncbi:hypothetical protein [Helicobacter rodentium]|uniref:hypothetical protein n=1 Tax=Helicobacter rodentium TaxID=59617 RepID=UPI0023F1697B|nr:hypothetical protein [Helicobacter rodentium]